MIPFFISFEILGLLLLFLAGAIAQIVGLIKERKMLTKFRFQKLIVFICLLALTLNQSAVNKIIEKVDWKLFYKRRIEIVEQVRDKEINSNTDKNFWTYKVPYKFPIISNGGNDVFISRNDSLNVMTVEFYVFRNYHESPSIKFIYTTDFVTIDKIEKKIDSKPNRNWKLEKNWYGYYDEIYN